MPQNTPMKMQWITVDGRQTPIVLPQIWNHEKQDWEVTSDQNRLPVDAQLTGSIDVTDIDKLLANQKQIINVMQADKLIFGVHWDKSSSPKLTRIDDAIGLVANAGVDGELVRNDFDRMPIFGEMTEVEDEYGNKFIRIPKFYIQKSSGKNHLILRVSKTKYPGFYLPYVFWDFENNKELDYLDFGKFNASLSGDKLESKTNKHPLVATNIVNFREYAKNNNVDGVEGYQQLDLHASDVLQTLFTIEFATLNSQNVMRGFTSGPYAEAHTVTVAQEDENYAVVSNSTANQFVEGQSIGIGTSRGGQQVAEARALEEIADYDSDNKKMIFDGDPVSTSVGNYFYSNGWKSGFSYDIASSSGSIGSNTSGKYPCMYRGIENPWGSIYEWVDGININDHQVWVAKNADDYASNVFASPYEKLGYENSPTNGYVIEMGFDSALPFAQFPTTVGGGSTTYYGDNYYQNLGQRIARFGGAWANGVNAGVWLWHLYYSSGNTYVASGGRLLKKAS